jgi:hypothetical protein
MLKQLKNEVSNELAKKGLLQVGAVYDKAAKALADNFNNLNRYSVDYKNIAIVFDKEFSHSERQFSYNKSYYGSDACSLELNLISDWIFTIK